LSFYLFEVVVTGNIGGGSDEDAIFTLFIAVIIQLVAGIVFYRKIKFKKMLK